MTARRDPSRRARVKSSDEGSRRHAEDLRFLAEASGADAPARAVTIAALIVSIIAILIAGAALIYTRRADAARVRAERVAPLERIRGAMRDVAATQATAALDPMAPQRLRAELARLHEAIAVVDVDLPDCSEYASSADPSMRPAAERELERAIADAGQA